MRISGRSMVGIFLAGFLFAPRTAELSAQTVREEVNQANIYLQTNMLADAIRHLRRCLAIDPNESFCLLSLSNVLVVELQRYAEALPVARAAVAQLGDPGMEDHAGRLHAIYGIALASIKDHELALEHLEKAEALLPENHELRFRVFGAKSFASHALDNMAGHERMTATVREVALRRKREGRAPLRVPGNPDWADYAAKVDAHYNRVAYRIKELVRAEGNGWLVRIEADSLDWLTAGQKAILFAIRRPEEGVTPRVIGSAQVQEVGVDPLVVALPDMNGDEPHQVRPGDLVIADASVTWNTPPTVLLSLARLGITITGQGQEEPLLDPRSIRSFDDIRTPEIALARMARAVRDYAAGLSTYLSQDIGYDEELPSGPYKGLTVLEVMERATSEDILQLLYFLEENPYPFMGAEMGIEMTFAGWVEIVTTSD